MTAGAVMNASDASAAVTVKAVKTAKKSATATGCMAKSALTMELLSLKKCHSNKCLHNAVFEPYTQRIDCILDEKRAKALFLLEVCSFVPLCELFHFLKIIVSFMVYLLTL